MSNYDSDEYSDSEEGPIIEKNSNVMVAIDCSPTMFDNEAYCFKTAITAVSKILYDLIVNLNVKNKIAVSLFHPNHHNFINFDTNFLAGYKSVQNLLQMDVKNWSSEFKNDPVQFNFSSFLIETKKKFVKIGKNSLKSFYFITNNPDPCLGDDRIKFQAIQELQEMSELKIYFNLMPLVEEYDYASFFEEVFTSLSWVRNKFYYNEEFLTGALKDIIIYKVTNRNISIFTHDGSQAPILCIQHSCIKSAKILPNKTVTVDGRKELTKKIAIGENIYDIRLKLGWNETIKELTKVEKVELEKTPHNLGIILQSARLERTSVIGMNLRKPQLLKPKLSHQKTFLGLWNSCVENALYLQGTIKYKEGGIIHAVELIPVIANQQPQFKLITIPWVTNLTQNEKIHCENLVDDEDNAKVQLVAEFIEAATINDYNPVNVQPYVYGKQINYIKSELLGPGFNADEKTNLLDDKMYDADLTSILEQLSDTYPNVVKRKNAKAGGATSKKSKQ